MRLLLVDDEEELTKPLQRLLINQGYAVDVATDGKTGWQLAQTQTYDLLILDWVMPIMSGVELCRSLRQTGDHTPVLFLSAKDTLDERVEGLDSGADDYLVKPFELKELLARIRALLRRTSLSSGESLEASSEKSEPQTLVFANLELDINSQVLYRDRQSIPLSEKECQLLAYFMQHPNQLLTHDQIQHHIWHEDIPTNTLVAQIRLLRRKIDQDSENSLINTVYGKGYRFG
ncbi:response regulator with CheY-like receiver domain and winged-helix DNA-binding domain [Synechococcus sp. PCC 7502]|uniref:two-component system response regulator RppA n=1 Tax=Synechococcus sp. PCC 7502 TaxID=1173263 RepID=UPI00029FCE2E|nr:two-component system response regulator RppA [Synechococcus sp. PCC 7502]AFY74576.1 response regulator with CheY-like receiver domain and winged-helix DNA-binding domain [Synechococcus sp. PCC 7502]